MVAVISVDAYPFWFSQTLQGFPNGVAFGGDSLGKIAKNCMKMTKSAFLGQNSGGEMGGGQANFSGRAPPPN